MRNNLTRKLVLGALFAALIAVVTLFAKFPVPGPSGAYVNAGDGVIYAAGFVMGGPWAAAAAGIGSMLADLLAGVPVYAPATLVIKALMGLLVGAAFYGKKVGWLRMLLFMVLGSVIMVAGYGLYEFFVMGYATAIANMPYNLIQAGGGVVIGLLLALVVKRVIPVSWQDTYKK